MLVTVSPGARMAQPAVQTSLESPGGATSPAPNTKSFAVTLSSVKTTLVSVTLPVLVTVNV